LQFTGIDYNNNQSAVSINIGEYTADNAAFCMILQNGSVERSKSTINDNTYQKRKKTARCNDIII